MDTTEWDLRCTIKSWAMWEVEILDRLYQGRESEITAATFLYYNSVALLHAIDPLSQVYEEGTQMRKVGVRSCGSWAFYGGQYSWHMECQLLVCGFCTPSLHIN